MDPLEELDDAIKKHFGKREVLAGPTEGGNGIKAEPRDAGVKSEGDDTMEGDKEANSILIRREAHSIVAKRVLDLVSNRHNKGFGGLKKMKKIKTEPSEVHHDSKMDVGESVSRAFSCTCVIQCLGKFEDVEHQILTLRDMKKAEKEMEVMKALSLSRVEGKRNQYTYTYQGKSVCKDAFKYAFDVESFALKAIMNHMDKKGLAPRYHGNKFKRPANTLTYEQVQYCVNFIVKKGKDFGKPMQSSTCDSDDDTLYLPATVTKKAMHKEYADECEELSQKYAGITSFKNIWRQCCPHIRITDHDDTPRRTFIKHDISKATENNGEKIRKKPIRNFSELQKQECPREVPENEDVAIDNKAEMCLKNSIKHNH